ncbi:MAG: DapH/DapD/GlmU-related protein [Phycisphaerae bacterium]
MSEASLTPSAGASRSGFDPGPGIQFVLILDVALRLLIWCACLTVAACLTTRWTGPLAFSWSGLSQWGTTWSWAMRAALFVLLFNAAYVVALVVLQLVVRRPRHGHYSLSGALPDVNLLYACVLALLIKARYQPPFPGFLVPQFAQIAPFRWLLGIRFGPHSRSVFLTDPVIMDPHDVTIGRNVTIGYQSSIAGHLEERDAVTIAPTVIEDDVLIGGYSAVAGGVHIKRGALIGAHSFVRPGTVVGENEFWAGVPAKKIKDLD